MPFTVKKSDGTVLVTVQDTTTDQSATSLSLPGKGTTGYALSIAQNFTSLLENFASTTPPARPLPGQIWYDENSLLLRVNSNGLWVPATPDAFGVSLDTLPGPTIAGNIGGTSNGANRIGGSTGVALVFNGATTTISIFASEGKIIAAGSAEAIPNASLPATITLEGKTFDFKARFPNGLCAGIMLATDSANYIYGGSTQFTDLLTKVPYLLAGDDTSTVANTIVVTVPATISTYSKYLAIESRVNVTNTGACQININGLGLKNVVRRDTSPMQAGDLLSTFYYHFIYDGLQFRVDDAQANGYVGPTGPQGAQGLTGATGAASTVVGPTGPQGPAGPAGAAGSNANLIGGEGVQVVNGQINLDVPDLFENDNIQAADTFSYFSVGDGHHRKTTFANLASNVLTGLANPSSTATFQPVTTDTQVGNNVLATIPFTNASAVFATGFSDRFTFTKAGIYTIDAFIQMKVNTNNDAGGGPAATARAYGAYYMYKNGVQIVNTNQNGTAYNYIAPLSTLISRTAYFNVGDYIQYKISGTGDGFNANGNFLSASTYVTINSIL